MKIAVVLGLCLCSVWMSLGEARPEPPSSQYGVPSSGYDGGPAGFGGGFGGRGGGYNDPLAQEANYMFMYEVQDAASGNDFGHMEQRQGEVARGSYHVLLPDGRMQKVDYVADQDGYRPVISYTMDGRRVGASLGVAGGYGGAGYSGGSGGAGGAGGASSGFASSGSSSGAGISSSNANGRGSGAEDVPKDLGGGLLSGF